LLVHEAQQRLPEMHDRVEAEWGRSTRCINPRYGRRVSSEPVDQIFSAFITSKPQGTGMGLPISGLIIESHGGRLWATPNTGPGATFQFVSPIEPSAHQHA